MDHKSQIPVLCHLTNENFVCTDRKIVRLCFHLRRLINLQVLFISSSARSLVARTDYVITLPRCDRPSSSRKSAATDSASGHTCVNMQHSSINVRSWNQPHYASCKTASPLRRNSSPTRQIKHLDSVQHLTRLVAFWPRSLRHISKCLVA